MKNNVQLTHFANSRNQHTVNQLYFNKIFKNKDLNIRR